MRFVRARPCLRVAMAASTTPARSLANESRDEFGVSPIVHEGASETP